MKPSFALSRGTSLVVAAAAILALPAPAGAQGGGGAGSESAPFAPPAASSSASFAPVGAATAGFGGAGQWVLSVQSANDASTALSFRGHNGGSWSLRIQPALDTFLVTNLSVGGVVGFNHDSGGGSTGVVLGARAGYALVLGGPVGFWPTAGIFGSYTSVNHASNGSAYLGLYAPFIIHPVAHFFLGLGPTFNLGLNNGNGTDFGVDFTLGGWI